MAAATQQKLTTVFSSSISTLEPQFRTVTTLMRGSPEELLKELRYQKKTGEIRISLSQGGVGIMKWIQTEKI
jgi:hypothetical protein